MILNYNDFLNEKSNNENGKFLGKGEEGACYLMDDGNIKKIFHRGVVPIAYQAIYQTRNFYKVETLPQVYEVGDDYIIRESVKPKTSLCKKYYKIATTYDMGSNIPMFRWVMQHGYYDPDTNSVISCWKGVMRDKDAIEVFEWLYKLKYELSQVAGEHAGLGDFGIQNFGETKDGRVIMFDF